MPASRDSILLIDDEPLLLMELAEFIRGLGYRCITAENATHGHEILKEDTTIKLVITDLRMPGLSGLTIVKTVGESRQGIFCVLLTGYNTNADQLEAQRLGAYEILKKPVAPHLLAQTIDRIMG